MSELSSSLQPEAVSTPDAPAAIGPYSQAIRVGGFLFISGQIPLDPKTAQIVGGDAKSQAQQVMKNLQAILGSEGLEFTAVAKTTIYLKDLKTFGDVNSVYESFLKKPFPARATVQVAALPRDVWVEIDAVACYPK